MIGRRSFMSSILAAGVAPAAIGSGILMPVRSMRTNLNGDADVFEATLLGFISPLPGTETVFETQWRWQQMEINRVFSMPTVLFHADSPETRRLIELGMVHPARMSA